MTEDELQHFKLPFDIPDLGKLANDISKDIVSAVTGDDKKDKSNKGKKKSTPKSSKKGQMKGGKRRSRVEKPQVG